MSDRPPLRPGYYLLNLETVIAEVRRRYEDLLRDEERAVLDDFRELPENARRLYVRMLLRKGPWFRPDDLSYEDIGPAEEPLEVLGAAGFCEGALSADPQELLPLLTREDLGHLLTELGLPASKRALRGELVQSLESCPAEKLGDRLRAWLRPVRLRHLDLWRLLQVLFFGNQEQDLSSFVVADLGVMRFEEYAVDSAARVFQSRHDVDFLLSLTQLREQLDQNPDALAEVTDTTLAMAPHPGLRQQRRFQGCLNELGRAWERAGELDRALACYARSERPPARERTARVLAAKGDLAQACALVLEMAAAPRDQEEARFVRVFLHRHRKASPEAAAWLADHPAPDAPPEVRLTLPRHPSGSVEAAVLDHAHQEGWQGCFTENGLWNALFGLVFWDVLFAPVPGAFVHPFQGAPLDLGSPQFYLARRNELEARLAEIEEPGRFAEYVLETARAKWGVACSFVAWKHLSWTLLEAAVRHIPPSVGAAILRTMAPHPRAFDSGFPDLFLWREDPPGWRLWEVKGPGDTLRAEQAWWLGRFRDLGCDVAVVRVTYL